MGNHYDPRDPEWDFETQRRKEAQDNALLMSDPKARADRADELLAHLLDDLGTGPALAPLRAQARKIKLVLRGLDW